jgi:DNA-binding GntR family transcriptional regulator
MSPTVLESLERALARMKVAAENEDTKNYWKQHILFHEIFIDACGNELLISLLKTLRMQIMWYRLSYEYYKEDFKSSYRIHEKIMALFRSRHTDPDRLEAVVRTHIEVAVGKFLSYLDEHGKLKAFVR